MSTVFNKNNTGFETGKYPLFLGDELGLYDSVNIAYPEIERLYQEQMSQIWNEFEVDLTQDKQDMLDVARDTVDLMVKTISWQHLVDSVANRSIAPLLTQYATNSELEAMMNAQTLFETIHARTYSHIVKQTFVDPEQMLRETYSDVQVLIRSESIIAAFDNLKNMPDSASKEEKAKVIILAVVALFALEAIAFMASFAVTFAIAETGVFQGIGKNVTLICRDEVLHTRMDCAIIDILRRDKFWSDVIEDTKQEIRAILDDIVRRELEWTDYLFSEGRKVVGLNSSLLKQYVLYMADPVYKFIGLGQLENAPLDNPLPYMEKYIKSTRIQAANQEIQNSSYKVGSVKDDTEELNLDEDW